MGELSNYIPVSRKLFDHDFWDEKREFSRFEAWLDLIQTARFEDAETRKLIGNRYITWGRGELVASLRYLAERWGWSKNKVDCYLKLLISEQMITKRTAEGTAQTIITICKYDSYNTQIKKTGQGTGQQRDRKGTAQGQQRDKTNKEEERIRKDNNGEDISSADAFAPEPVISLFTLVKNSFLIFYAEKKETEYYFQAKDGEKVKSLISKIKFKIKEKSSAQKEKDVPDEEVLEGFELFIKNAYKVADQFILNNFSLSTLDSKFNDLYAQIKNGKAQNNFNGNQQQQQPERGVTAALSFANVQRRQRNG